MNRFLLITLCFISISNLPSYASSVTIKKGDTLSKIANENNFSIKEIMDANNILDANKIIEGQKIILPLNSKEYKIHVVKKGDNIIKISELYNIKKTDLIELNKIENPNYLYESQKLFIPGSNAEVADSFQDKDVDQNSLEKNLNSNEKNSIELSFKKNTSSIKKTKEESSINWKTYGPLKINWDSWKSKDGSFVANTIHKTGKPLFIAINCPKRIINRTGSNGSWREWIAPQKNFEYDLLNDVCKKKDA